MGCDVADATLTDDSQSMSGYGHHSCGVSKAIPVDGKLLPYAPANGEPR
jgi:hypothetical protein